MTTGNIEQKKQMRAYTQGFLSRTDTKFAGPVWDAVHRTVLRIYSDDTTLLQGVKLLVDITEQLVVANLNGIIANGLEYPEEIYDKMLSIYGEEMLGIADDSLHHLVSNITLIPRDQLESEINEYAQKVRDWLEEQ